MSAVFSLCSSQLGESIDLTSCSQLMELWRYVHLGGSFRVSHLFSVFFYH